MKKQYCDLHLHSYYSDGTNPPKFLVDMALKSEIGCIALTDHNTVKGIPEFLAEASKAGVDAIGGIEFSVDYRGRELHLLALGVNEEYFAEIEEMMDEYLKIRERSNREMIDALSADGYVINFDEIVTKSGNGYVNRAHIAAELVEKGYCTSIKEAFATLLSKDGPYFRERKYPGVFEMIEYIEKIGAVSVIAHPFLHFEEMGLREFLSEARCHGLGGMETVYTTYSEEQTAIAKAIAKEFDLLESGGSDFHGSTKPDVAFGVGYGNLKIPASFAEKIKGRVRKI